MATVGVTVDPVPPVDPVPVPVDPVPVPVDPVPVPVDPVPVPVDPGRSQALLESSGRDNRVRGRAAWIEAQQYG